MPNRGQLVILLIVGTSIAAGAFAWWFRLQEGRQALELWGSRAGTLILNGSQAELLRLEPVVGGQGADGETIQVDDQTLRIAARHDIRRARGLLHVRHALVMDSSFVWQSAAPSQCEPTWPWALRFAEDSGQATLLLDFQCRQAKLADTGRQGEMVEATSRGIQEFVQRNADASTP